MISVVLLTEAARVANHPLAAALARWGGLEVVVTAERADLRGLRLGSVVVADLAPEDAAPLEAETKRLLTAHVQRGGGLVALGAALDGPSGALFGGVAPGLVTPLTEIVAHPTADDPLTRRLDAEFIVRDRAALWFETPPAAVPLLRTVWQLRPATLAWRRSVGAGGVVALGLGRDPDAWHAPELGRFVSRAAKALAGQTEGAPIRIAMIGYGAIGREHGEAVSQVPGLEYAAVCDTVPARLAEAQRVFPGIRVATDLRAIAADPDIDAVIISTPPNSHAAIAAEFLRAGKHVVTEKPFCLTRRDADDLIALAADQQRALTVYQCRRWDADYLAIQRAVASGALGEVFHVETFIGGFAHPCDYWHSDATVSGGAVFDWGSHYLDWMLHLIPDRVVRVSGVEHKRVWHDVTNADQTTVRLTFAGGQEAELLQSDIAAALKPKWYILGTGGALVAEWRHEVVKTRRWSGDLIEARLAPAEALPAVTLYTRTARTNAIDACRLELPTPPPFAFHRNLADHLHNGEPLAVDPAQARRNVAVMEAARRSAGQGGAPIALDDDPGEAEWRT